MCEALARTCRRIGRRPSSSSATRSSTRFRNTGTKPSSTRTSTSRFSDRRRARSSRASPERTSSASWTTLPGTCARDSSRCARTIERSGCGSRSGECSSVSAATRLRSTAWPARWRISGLDTSRSRSSAQAPLPHATFTDGSDFMCPIAR